MSRRSVGEKTLLVRSNPLPQLLTIERRPSHEAHATGLTTPLMQPEGGGFDSTHSDLTLAVRMVAGQNQIFSTKGTKDVSTE